MKTTSLSHYQNDETITINTLRERAGEMLRVADHLEAVQGFTGRNHVSTAGIRASPHIVKRPMSAVARKRIAKATKARWAVKRKTLGIVASKAA